MEHTIDIKLDKPSQIVINGHAISARWVLENRFFLHWSGGVFTVSDSLGEPQEFDAWTVAFEWAMKQVTNIRKQRVIITEEAIQEIQNRSCI